MYSTHAFMSCTSFEDPFIHVTPDKPINGRNYSPRPPIPLTPLPFRVLCDSNIGLTKRHPLHILLVHSAYVSSHLV